MFTMVSTVALDAVGTALVVLSTASSSSAAASLPTMSCNGFVAGTV